MSARGVLLVAFAAVMLVGCEAAIAKDEVTSLPGWNSTLPSKHYSGLLPVANGAGYLHYWFIESEKNPATDPVVVWLNGGPGSSSLIGLLTENGQFMTNNDSVDKDGNIRLLYNKYSWSQVANMLYIEQPKGVGFSYCENPLKCFNNDSTVGTEMADFLDEFFKGFSEYAQNDFYITGESYAGIYIPEIMMAVDKRGNTNLKGAAIGDGCIGNEVSTCGFEYQADRISVEFYYGHGMYPQPLYNQIKSTCGNFSSKESLACASLIAQMNKDIGNFDIYNVYDQCGNDQVTLPHEAMRRFRQVREFKTEGFQAFAYHPQLQKGVSGANNDYACGAENIMSKWLAQPAVQEALHVSKQGVQYYTRTVADLRPQYAYLAKKYRMLIYSGSVDACVPYWGSEEWTRELGFPVKEPWRPWNSPSADEPTTSNIQAGYVTTYDAGQHTFTFLTVAGAGHMVPQYKPAQAFSMFERFLNDKPY
eukprot:m.152922 g.152922  ORF g.152922 m.152922 type:complete len:476 (+) comp14274_c0_seq7:138-1565(+)